MEISPTRRGSGPSRNWLSRSKSLITILSLILISEAEPKGPLRKVVDRPTGIFRELASVTSTQMEKTMIRKPSQSLTHARRRKARHLMYRPTKA